MRAGASPPTLTRAALVPADTLSPAAAACAIAGAPDAPAGVTRSPRSGFMSRCIKTRTVVGALAALALAGCAPGDGPGTPTAPAERAAAAKVKRWDVNPTADWTDRATALNRRTPVNVVRLYAYLALAQLRAAEDARSVRPHPPIDGAIGGASAAVLAAYFPAATAEIEAALDAQSAAPRWPGAKHQDFAAGEAIGRAAAARVIAFSASDGFGSANPGTPPVGPGFWVYNGGPMARGGLGGRPLFLASASEFRSPPPPAFGSAAYLAALAEVRQFSVTRTPEQRAIALYWNVNQGPTTNAAVETLATELLRANRVDAVESARTLLRMNGAIYDATIGCFEAKYAYWFIRPAQADPTIAANLLFPTPPHPSYPAAHSCVTGAAVGVLALAFPDAGERLAALAAEAGMSRVYGGIHYRFDTEAGLALGRAVAATAFTAHLDGVAVQ